MDMALAMVEEDHGRAVALAVAQELVMFLKRPGGQSQFSRHLQAQHTRDQRLGELELWVLDNLNRNLSVDELATRVSMSPRHFARRFAAEVGTTPAENGDTPDFRAGKQHKSGVSPFSQAIHGRQLRVDRFLPLTRSIQPIGGRSHRRGLRGCIG